MLIVKIKKKTLILYPTPRNSNSVVLTWGLRKINESTFKKNLILLPQKTLVLGKKFGCWRTEKMNSHCILFQHNHRSSKHKPSSGTYTCRCLGTGTMWRHSCLMAPNSCLCPPGATPSLHRRKEDKGMGFGVKQTRTDKCTLPHSNNVILGKLLNVSKP